MDTSTIIACIECAGDIQAQPRFTGEIVDCSDCGAELEVTALAPLTLQVAPDIEEDWGE